MTQPRTSLRPFSAVVGNLAAIAVFAVLSFAGTRVFNEVPAGELVQAVAAAVAIVSSLRIRAHVATFVLSAVLAFGTAEFVAHTVWGKTAVQGGEVHLTVMAAGAIGVALGAWMTRLMRGPRNIAGVADAVEKPQLAS